MKMIVHVEGMHCIRCAGKVEGAMHDLGLDAVVDLEKKICTVEGEAEKEAICEVIEELGFQVTGIE
ncbi:MAG: heavy-metal-associated domain-containing protein [Clostridia bacterium]|nr:heavy-metal-associated domain-containing protein [Clostridia bacterium]